MHACRIGSPQELLQAAVVDKRGTLLKQERIPNQDESIKSFFDHELMSTRKNEIVIESSSTWYHAFELLSEDKRNHVVLSNPVKTKAIASGKVKTDKVDAITLAQLLRGGYIPECYIPPGHIMNLREMVRFRASLVRSRTSAKNKIHAILLMKRIKIDQEDQDRSRVQTLHNTIRGAIEECVSLFFIGESILVEFSRWDPSAFLGIWRRRLWDVGRDSFFNTRGDCGM